MFGVCSFHFVEHSVSKCGMQHVSHLRFAFGTNFKDDMLAWVGSLNCYQQCQLADGNELCFDKFQMQNANMHALIWECAFVIKTPRISNDLKQFQTMNNTLVQLKMHKKMVNPIQTAFSNNLCLHFSTQSVKLMCKTKWIIYIHKIFEFGLSPLVNANAFHIWNCINANTMMSNWQCRTYDFANGEKLNLKFPPSK